MIAPSRIVLLYLLFFLTGCSSVPSKAVAAGGVSGETDTVVPMPRLGQQQISFAVRPGVPAKVFILETTVMVQAGNGAALMLESIYLPLYRGWGNQYLKTGDYDRDGNTDLAVLQSVGHGGNDRCYAIYRYNGQTGRFRQQKSFDLCGI